MFMDLHAGIATYSYEELCSATDKKSSVMKLGQGGFGVFMGRLRQTLVAVKFFRSVSCLLSFLSIRSHIHTYTIYM